MRRAGFIAVGVVGGVAMVALTIWLVAFRDTSEPVSVGEAVTSFRADTEPGQTAPLPIPKGVYVYATSGFEKTDALTGITHRYPRKTTIAVGPAACGMRLTWGVLEGRSTTWVYCLTDQGWRLRSQDEGHTFFAHHERTTYLCNDALIRPAAPSIGQRWPVSCSTDDTEEKGTIAVVAREFVRAGGSRVLTRHVRKVTRFTGDIRGSARHDLWFHERIGVPVKVVMVSHTTNGSPIGDVHYDEVVTLRLISLRPLR